MRSEEVEKSRNIFACCLPSSAMLCLEISKHISEFIFCFSCNFVSAADGFTREIINSIQNNRVQTVKFGVC